MSKLIYGNAGGAVVRFCGASTDTVKNGACAHAAFHSPSGIAAFNSDGLVVVDVNNTAIRRVLFGALTTTSRETHLNSPYSVSTLFFLSVLRRS